MILAIEYQLQTTVLSYNECSRIMAKINKVIKHKVNLSSNTPNSIIYDKELYEVKNIYNLQQEMLLKKYNVYE